jgi:hypothetical protein
LGRLLLSIIPAVLAEQGVPVVAEWVAAEWVAAWVAWVAAEWVAE